MCIYVIYPVIESAGVLRAVSKGLFYAIEALVGKKKPTSETVEASGA